MFRANRAFIMAAGYGNRLRPVTDVIPKPLIPVHGVRIIDTQIEALHQHGIYEIYVITGHLRHCFDGLEAQYPGLKVLNNPDYDQGNNITSLYHAREYLDACVIMDGDIIIRNPQVLLPEYEHSTYCCTWFNDIDTEWVFRHKDWIITDVLQQGGTGWGLRSISFWTPEDARRLRTQLTEVYEHQGLRDAYWDQVALVNYWGDYRLGIRPIPDEDILEIDTYEELCQEDPSYLSWEGRKHG